VRIAEQEAQLERAEAELRQQRAALHEEGMADHELVEEHERERFVGTSAIPETQSNADGDAGWRDEQSDEDDRHGLLGRFRRRGSEEPAGRR
jgi:hypothetical protein